MSALETTLVSGIKRHLLDDGAEASIGDDSRQLVNGADAVRPHGKMLAYHGAKEGGKRTVMDGDHGGRMQVPNLKVCGSASRLASEIHTKSQVVDS